MCVYVVCVCVRALRGVVCISVLVVVALVKENAEVRNSGEL